MKKTGTLDQPFQFSTKEYDPQTGLSYYGYRFYSARLGRWINRDPLGERGGVNLYGFVGNNPGNRRDPKGLEWEIAYSHGINVSYGYDGALLFYQIPACYAKCLAFGHLAAIEAEVGAESTAGQKAGHAVKWMGKWFGRYELAACLVHCINCPTKYDLKGGGQYVTGDYGTDDPLADVYERD